MTTPKSAAEKAEAYAESSDNESGAFLSHQLKAIREKAWLNGHAEGIAEAVETLERVQALISGCQHASYPQSVRELDGSISQVRSRLPAGEAYDLCREALTRFKALAGEGE